MSRNQNSHFALNPRVNIQRSRMDLSNSVKLTANAGKLTPFYLREVLPGDSFEVNTSLLARMQTLIVPLMDDLYVDTYYFFVPNRILWKHWEAFLGDSEEPWYDDTEYSVPSILVSPSSTAKVGDILPCVQKGSVADYLGLPLPNTDAADVEMQELNHLPFRAYVKIYNDWFRNENVQGYATFNTEDAGVTLNADTDAFYGGDLLPVNKYKDYFTSALPQPQKGPEVTIGVGNNAPVFATNMDHNVHTDQPIRFTPTGSGAAFTTGSTHYAALYADDDDIAHMVDKAGSIGSGSQFAVAPTNLWSDISAVTGISINELRTAFATQKFYEQAARGGTRYIEILANMFNVTNGDARLQRPEYLSGNRIRVNINQAIQNSETANTPLGNIGAYSLTTDNQKSFTKSFTEHGWLVGVLAIRYDHSYSQGIPRHFSRRGKFDYYWPAFNGVGEQPVLNKEIYFSGDSSDEEVFGYQEYAGDYRYSNNMLLAEMRPNYAQTLDYWHLGDDYDSLPTLSSDWMVENGETVDRAIAVSQRVSDQFLIDMYIDCKATRPMPLFSVPGMDIL